MKRSLIIPNDKTPSEWVNENGELYESVLLEYKAIRKVKDDIKALEEEWRNSLKECLEKYGIRGYDGNGLSIRYKDAGEREKFDKKGFCKDPARKALYDEFVSFSPVKSSVVVKDVEE